MVAKPNQTAKTNGLMKFRVNPTIPIFNLEWDLECGGLEDALGHKE